jgi:hypothetical protein
MSDRFETRHEPKPRQAELLLLTSTCLEAATAPPEVDLDEAKNEAALVVPEVTLGKTLVPSCLPGLPI